MAELGLAILAVPESVLALVSIARSVCRRIDAFKSASQSLQQIYTFSSDVQQGTLSVGLSVIRTLIRDLQDETLKNVAAGHVGRLQEALSKVEAVLGRCVDEETGKVNRLYFAAKGESELKVLGDKIAQWQMEFGIFVALAQAKSCVKPFQRRLTWQRFRTISAAADDEDEGPVDGYSRLVAGATYARIATAEFKDEDGLRELRVLIERPSLRDDTEESHPSSERAGSENTEDLAIVADFLSDQLMSSDGIAGVLPCLGYRTKPFVELIFQIPDGLGLPTSLHRVMTTVSAPRRRSRLPTADLDQEVTWETKVDNEAEDGEDEKWRREGGEKEGFIVEKDGFWRQQVYLGLQLCEAVYSVRRAKIVHKNIRPETIILFHDEAHEEDITSEVAMANGSDSSTLNNYLLLLTCWNSLRRTDDPSSRTGDDDWVRNIYRHPERQGLHPERRYNANHDVYSLGVCLLEIGLWDPLIVQGDDERTRKMSSLYESTARKMGFITSADAADITHEKLTKPSTVRKVLHAMSNDELPARMGGAYADVTAFCLICLEKRNSNGDVDSKGLRPEVMTGVIFDDKILKPLGALLA